MNKKLMSILSMLLILSMVFVGCAKKEAPSTDSTDVPKDAKGELKVSLVVAGGLGDRSFYDSSNAGLEMAKEKLGIEGKVLECKNDPSLYGDQLIQASNISDVVVVVGFEFYDVIKEVAQEFPDKKYIYIDNTVEGVDNITCIDYMENEGSFLAGALAAMATNDTNIKGMNEEAKVGMVGGMDIPVVRNFQVGYEAGAKYVNPDVKVETIFAGDFEDPAKGKESALALYAKGVDIVFQVAGKTGEGVFEAAKDVNQYAIGVDTDQRFINPDAIVASMTKGIALSIYESIDRIQKGEFKSGSIYKYGINENGVDVAFGTEDMKQIVTEDMIKKVNEIKEKIKTGEITVPEAK
ncbi:BMP family ABC transporter substrate-binding protein [Lutibacter sp. B2]|nr:BMP family ABC transporter substrate-binding protein [Lutibacter sp. B2]